MPEPNSIVQRLAEPDHRVLDVTWSAGVVHLYLNSTEVLSLSPAAADWLGRNASSCAAGRCRRSKSGPVTEGISMDIERALKDQGERQDAVERAVEVTRLSMSVRAHRLEKPSCIPQRLSSKKTSRGAVRRAGAKPSSKKTTRWTRMIRITMRRRNSSATRRTTTRFTESRSVRHAIRDRKDLGEYPTCVR